MSDPNLKTIRELLYYIADHRAGSTSAVAGQGFLLDAERGDTIEEFTNADVLTINGVTITVRHGNYLWKEDRTFTRPRRKDEPIPGTDGRSGRLYDDLRKVQEEFLKKQKPMDQQSYRHPDEIPMTGEKAKGGKTSLS